LQTFYSVIGAISDEFKSCLPSSKLKKSLCEKVRYHYSDLRRYFIWDPYLEEGSHVLNPFEILTKEVILSAAMTPNEAYNKVINTLFLPEPKIYESTETNRFIYAWY
jgi:hypothetical protein